MQQRWVPGEVKNMISNGTITDDSTVAAYSLWRCTRSRPQSACTAP